VAFILLAQQASRRGIGLGYLDPIDPVEAQDEAVYSHIALRIAESAQWRTPEFLGRYFLYKPPLLYWLSAASVCFFGASPFALRLPCLLAGAAVCALVFLWSARIAGSGGGLVAASLLLTSSQYVNLAGRTMTDILLCAAITAALFLLARDPRLSRPGSWIGFGIATGCAVLAKSAAGSIAPLVLAAFALFARREDRPRMRSVFGVAAVAATVALPWFVYQYTVHPRWFWSEFVLVELLAWGAGAPPQTSSDNVLVFYALRLLRASPALCAGAIVAAVYVSRKLIRREVTTLLPAAWVAVTIAAIFGFQFRNATYLLPLLPPLAVMAGAQLPLGRGRTPLSAALLLIWVTPLWTPGREMPPRTVAVRRLLEQRCDRGRQTELIVVSTVDQFYATVLPFPKVRYALAAPEQRPSRFALDFGAMGITVPVSEFLELEKHRPRFAAEMRSWGLAGNRALASVILYSDRAALVRLVRESPQRDFLVPADLRGSLGVSAHRIAAEDGGHVLLESKDSHSASSLPDRSCRM
jgi:hypothetical protein